VYFLLFFHVYIESDPRLLFSLPTVATFPLPHYLPCSHPITKCKFSNPFVLIFIQDAGGVGGVMVNQLPLAFNVPTFQRSTSYLSFFQTLPHSFAFFCTFLHSRKTQPILFQAIPNSFAKTPGVGALLSSRAPIRSEAPLLPRATPAPTRSGRFAGRGPSC
jgi:hypothetical protein